jgi:hypothetical protein
MKLIVISQPKSGTYLCANILQNLGLEFTYLHILLDSYNAYDKDDIENCKRHPEKFRVEAPLYEPLSMIGEGQFAVCHLWRNKVTDLAVKDFKKIILYRDADEIFESYKTWIEETGRDRKPIKGKPEMVTPWTKCDNTFAMQFNDMVDKNINKLDELQMFLFGEITYNSLTVIEQSLNQPSLTKSHKRI